MAVDPRIKVYDLGLAGVDVDSSPLGADSHAAKRTQNATYDPTRERLGGLSKRPGLDRFNHDPMDGPVLGGLEAPYKGTAGAPASGGGGGGAAGQPGGTGDPVQGGGVGPGDAAGGGGGSGAVEVNGKVFNEGVALFGGGRIVVLGRQMNSAASAGWYVSTPGWTQAGYRIDHTNPNAGAPQGAWNSSFPPSASGGNQVSTPMTIANGTLFYAEDVYSLAPAVAPVLPRVRRLSADGNVDVYAFTIPDNPAILAIATIPSHLVWVTAMITEWGNGDACYIATYDKITTGASAGGYGRILRVTGLDSGSYAVQEVYNFFSNPIGVSTSCVPLCLENFLGSPWFGLWKAENTVDPTIGRLIPTDDTKTAWRVDKLTAITAPASAADVTCLRAYAGKLYIGMTTRNAAVAHATVLSLTPDEVLTQELTGSGGSAVSPNGFISMALFRDALYASYMGLNQSARIFKYDGTAWTTALSVGDSRFGYSLRPDGDYLYAFGGTPSTTNHSFLASIDGAVWVDQSAKLEGTLPHGVFSVSAPVNILFGIEQ